MSVRVVAQNALSLLSANLLGNLIGFAVNIVLVRYLGVERLGQYTYVTTYAALFGILSSWGLYLVLTREVASRPEAADARLGSVLLLQALLSPLALTVTVGSALLFHSVSEALLIALAAIGVVLTSVAGAYGAVVTGQEKIHLNAAVSAGMAGLWGLLVLGLVALRWGVLALVVLFVIHRLAHVWALRLACRRSCGVSPRYGLANVPVRGLLVLAAPFALMILLNDFYWNVGMILLGQLKGAGEVGTFSAAFRVISVLVTIVGIVSGVLYPRFSHLFAADPGGFAALVGVTRKYSLAVGIPLALVLSLLSDPLISLLFGPEFSAAGGSLQLLGWFFLLFCLYTPLSYAMVAMGAERAWLVLLAGANGVVIGGSLLLVPALGHLGLAWSLLGSGGFLATAVLLVMRAKGVPISPTPADLKAAAACGAMGLVLWVFRDVPVLAGIASVAAYAAILYFAGFLTAEERLSIRASLATPRER